MLCGQPVKDISQLSRSYVSCRRLRSITGFHNKKKLYFYEEIEETQGSYGGIVLCKNTIDEITDSIVKNDPVAIETGVEKLYGELQEKKEITGLLTSISTICSSSLSIWRVNWTIPSTRRRSSSIFPIRHLKVYSSGAAISI